VILTNGDTIHRPSIEGARMTVVESERGWDVVDDAGAVLASFPTNAQAWRYVDRHSGEPISRSEDVSSWIMSRIGTDNRQGRVPHPRGLSVRERLRRRNSDKKERNV
jgi:hypothetical protein